MRVALTVTFILCSCAGMDLRAPAATDDPSLARLITHRLANDPRLCPLEISVVVFGGGRVRLEGKVRSEVEQRRAEDLAREAGAHQIENRLQIDPSTGDPARC